MLFSDEVHGEKDTGSRERKDDGIIQSFPHHDGSVLQPVTGVFLLRLLHRVVAAGKEIFAQFLLQLLGMAGVGWKTCR